jgi:hypothetical protein
MYVNRLRDSNVKKSRLDQGCAHYLIRGWGNSRPDGIES